MSVVIQKQHHHVIGGDGRCLGGDTIFRLAWVIACAVLVGTGHQTLVLQFIVGRLTLGQGPVSVDAYLLVNRVVVGAVVGDVQAAIAVDQRQVAVAIETAYMVRSQGDEVAVVDVVDGGGGIAIDGDGVGIDDRALHRVTTGKHGVVDDDAGGIQTIPSVFIILLVPQGVQVFDGRILAGGPIVAVDGHVGDHLRLRLNEHLTVLGEHLLTVYIFESIVLVFVIVALVTVVVTAAVLFAIARHTRPVLVGTAHIAVVAAAEDVAGILGQTALGAYLSTMDMHQRLSEDIALGTAVHGFLFIIGHIAFAVPVVVTAAAAKDVAQYVAAVHLKTGGARLVNLGCSVRDSSRRIRFHRAAADGAYLTAAVEAAAHRAVIHQDARVVDVAVCHVAAAEHIAALVEQAVAFGLVVQLGHILILCWGALCCRVLVAVAYMAVVDIDIGRAEDAATLAAAVDVTHDGRVAVEEVLAAAEVADDHMRLAISVCSVVGDIADESLVIAHAAAPAAAIDVTDHAAPDVGVGSGSEVTAVVVIDATGSAGGIDVLVDGAAKQGDIGGADDVAAVGNGSVAKSAAVGVVRHRGALVDDDVGVVFVRLGGAHVHLGRSHQFVVAEVGLPVADVVVESVVGGVVVA